MSNICAICHQSNDGCCFIKGTAEYLQIGLFYPDIQRIADYLQKDVSYFTDNKVINSAIREFLSSKIHPIFDIMYHDDKYIALKKIDNRCMFLTDTGCSLPHEVRPIYCRLYPFWPSYHNEYINVLSSDDCLAQRESTLDWKVVNKHFGYSEGYIRSMFSELLEISHRP